MKILVNPTLASLPLSLQSPNITAVEGTRDLRLCPTHRQCANPLLQTETRRKWPRLKRTR